MSAEPQMFLEAEYGYPLDYARQGGQSTALAEKTKASLFRLTTLLECFWSFHEAMRLGKPLPSADEKLAQMGSLLPLNGRKR